MIRPRKRYVITTNSKHFMKKYSNLVAGLAVTRPEQVWVSDITYIRTDNGFCYLNLITDAFSRKIVGYAIARNMNTESMIEAYKMALKGRRYPHLELIHHSDRGLQYCSAAYVALSEEAGVKISMTQNGDPYENALAERMNRTMKEEFGLGGRLRSYEHGAQLTVEGIVLYNGRRPHCSLGMSTPNKVHDSYSFGDTGKESNLALPQQAETGSAGEQPVRNTAVNENDAGKAQSAFPVTSKQTIFVAMPKKTHMSRKAKVLATEATRTLS